MQKSIRELVLDYKTNPYHRIESNEFDHVILNFLNYDLSKNDFDILRNDMLKKIG